MASKLKVKPSVSVIIPTYNRGEQLGLLLGALEKQTCKNFEIIIVNDGSTDNTDSVLTWLEAFDKIRCLTQKNKGAATARNNGAAIARGNIIAFTDDDCIPDKNWLREGIKHFKDFNIVGVEGTIEKGQEEPTPTSCVTYTFKPGGYMTANMFYRKSAFEKARGFDTDFQSFREDTDLGWRIRKLGKIVHEPKAIVTHPTLDYSVLNFLKKHVKLRETYFDVLLYKKHPKEFWNSGEFVFGLSSHMFWQYLMVALLLCYLNAQHFVGFSIGRLGLLLTGYCILVFFHTRMRSSIGIANAINHPLKMIGLFLVWWIAFAWDIIQRVKAIFVLRRMLI